MWLLSAFLQFFFVFICTATPFLNSYLDSTSRESLLRIFNHALTSKELSVVHHGVAGLKLLLVDIGEQKKKELCDMVKGVRQDELSQLYHGFEIVKALGNCGIKIEDVVHKTVEAAVKKEGSKAQDIYLALSVAENAKQKVNQEEVAKALTNAIAKDDGVTSLSYTLNAASLMEKDHAEKFFDRVEDLVGQADDIDGKFLSLEGGVSNTAFGVYGVYALADRLGKSPNVKSDEAVKLANYLLSRRNVQTDRGAYLLLKTLNKLANNNFQIPVVFSLASSISISDTEKPLHIRVSNVLGETVGPLSVNLDAATHVALKEAVAAREQLKPVGGDKTNTLYELLLSNAKQRGFYNLALTVGSQDKRLVGTIGATLTVKILSKVRIENVTMAVFDRELAKPSNVLDVKEGAKLGRLLEADVHSKMEIKFVVQEASTGDAITVHQAFVAFVHKKTKQEIIFVSTPDQQNTYSFDIDFEKASKDFDHVSGKYAVRLIIGDAAITHPIDWNLVDVAINLPAVPAPKVKKSEQIIYEALSEIKHMFREPEKRPPFFVSDTFVVLCVVPLVILIVMWLRIGINFGNIPASPFVFVFHVGLIAIFGLYFIFWVRLNMFVTLKYLSIIGAVTFFSGNRLLRTLASKRKGKTE